MGRYIFRNCSHFFLKHAILTTPLERLRGAARRTGEPVPAAAGREPAAGQTKQFLFPYFSIIFPSPEQAAARKTGGREPFPLSPFAARRGPDGRSNPRTGAHTRSERG